VCLHPDVELSNLQVAHVESVEQPHRLVLLVWLTEEGTKQMSKVAAQHIGGHLAVLINSKVISAALIVEVLHSTPEVPAGLTVPLEPEQARQLARAVSLTWPDSTPREHYRSRARSNTSVVSYSAMSPSKPAMVSPSWWVGWFRRYARTTSRFLRLTLSTE
jgi:SecD-like export protein